MSQRAPNTLSSQPYPTFVATVKRNGYDVGASTVHSLPCTIHHDGERAAVGVYFRPNILKEAVLPTTCEDGESPSMAASPQMAVQLRGRKLIGREMPLPDNVAGIIMAPEETSTSGKSAILVETSFRAVHEWGHDRDPTTGESTIGSRGNTEGKVKRALDWFRIAEAVHDPIVIQ